MSTSEKVKFITDVQNGNASGGGIAGYVAPLNMDQRGEGIVNEQPTNGLGVSGALSRSGRTKSFNVFATNPANMAGGRGFGDTFTFDRMVDMPTRSIDPDANPRSVSIERWFPYVSPYLDIVEMDPRSGVDTRSLNKRTANPSIKRVN